MRFQKLPWPAFGGLVRLWALICAGPALTVTGALMTLVVWRGGWARELQAQQLTILGWALFANWSLLAVVIVALAAVRVRGQGPGGLEIEITGDANFTAGERPQSPSE